jgi:antitoxin component YwqK of YwqJK toxin-antitoxin module
LKVAITAVDGIPEGPFQYYHANGRLEKEGFYEDGAPNAPVKEYDEDGQLKT